MLNSKFFRLILSLFFIISSATRVSAQIAEVALGIDNATSYNCLRFAEKRLNTVRVTNQSTGKSNILTIKRAKKKIATLKKKNKKSIASIKKDIKKLKKRVAKLQRKLLLTEAVQAQIVSLQTKIETRESSLISRNTRQINFDELRKSITDCGKDEEIAGNFVPISGTFNDSRGRSIFYTHYYYVLNDWNPENQFYCVKDLNRGGALLRIQALQPNRCLVEDPFTDNDTCYLTAQEAFSGRYFSYVTGRVGIQKPGTCPEDPGKCSLSEAQTTVRKFINNLRLKFDRVLTSGSSCD